MNLIAHGTAFVSVKVVASDVRIERRVPNDSSYNRHFLDFEQVKDTNDGLQPFLVFKINFKINTYLRSLQIYQSTL